MKPITDLKDVPIFSFSDMQKLFAKTIASLNQSLDDIRSEDIAAANRIATKLDCEYRGGHFTTAEFVSRLRLIAECMEVHVSVVGEGQSIVSWEFS